MHGEIGPAKYEVPARLVTIADLKPCQVEWTIQAQLIEKMGIICM